MGFFIIQLTGQSASFGNFFVHQDGVFQIGGIHQFDAQTSTYPAGIIATERTGNLGLVHFQAGSSWMGASVNAFIDGYVSYSGNNAFTFPIGDDTNFQPIAISNGENTIAAYFVGSPSTAITSDFNGGVEPILPNGGPFSITAIDTDLSLVSNKEYWDVRGTTPAILTFYFDATSDISSLTNAELDKLTLVGWNGSQWVPIPSTLDAFSLDITQSNGSFSTQPSTLIIGSISTNQAISPNQYMLFTFGAKGSSIDIVDNDGDGIPEDLDCDDNDANLPAPAGTSCDDGDALTENDVIQSDGCTCEGEPIMTCTDADGDDICVEEDCDDTNPNVPAIPNTPCDDGDALTENDVIQSDGCTCQGIIPDAGVNCEAVQFIGGNQQITLTNLTAQFEKVEIIGANTGWQVVEICNNNCSLTQIISDLIPGDYQVKLNMVGADGGFCYRQETITVTDVPCTDEDGDLVCAGLDCDDTNPNLPTIPGTPCDDGDETTQNDVYLSDGCTCQGMTPCTDADEDGVCEADDCDDSNPNLPAIPNTPCDDGDEATLNDVYLADGCTCLLYTSPSPRDRTRSRMPSSA